MSGILAELTKQQQLPSCVQRILFFGLSSNLTYIFLWLGLFILLRQIARRYYLFIYIFIFVAFIHLVIYLLV